MGVSRLEYTPATTGERLIRFRIRNASAPGAQADANIVTPFKGRIKRILAVNDGNDSANWVADVVTAQGTATGAINYGDIGFANIAAAQAVETIFDPEDPAFEVEAGGHVAINTTTGNGSGTSIYGFLVIG